MEILHQFACPLFLSAVSHFSLLLLLLQMRISLWNTTNEELLAWLTKEDTQMGPNSTSRYNLPLGWIQNMWLLGRLALQIT